MSRITRSYGIVSGPKGPWDLALCLVDEGVDRSPHFVIDNDKMWEKEEKPVTGPLSDILDYVSSWHGIYPGVRITSLSKGRGRWTWYFTATPTDRIGRELTGIAIRGWFDFFERKGKIHFSKKE